MPTPTFRRFRAVLRRAWGAGALAAFACLWVPAPAAAAGWPSLAEPSGEAVHDASDDTALVIAVQDYAFAPDIPGAIDNAMAWQAWLRDVQGVPTVKTLVNAQATREEILAAAQGVAERVGRGGRTWLFFVGHGAPSQDGDDGLLLGVDTQQTAVSVEARGLRQQALLDVLVGDGGHEVVVVIDACFSGRAPSGDLVPGLAPLVPLTARSRPDVTVLTAAKGDEYAGPLPDGSRPAFSYLLLGALRGWGDRDGDGAIGASEALSWVQETMFRTTSGRTQTPTLDGPDILLGRGREAGPDVDALAPRLGSAGLEALAEAQRLRREAEAREADARAQVESERAYKLDQQAVLVQADARATWDQLQQLADGGDSEAVEAVRDFMKTWPSTVTVTVEDAEGRHQRKVSIPEAEQARAWLRTHDAGRSGRLTRVWSGVAVGAVGGAALVLGQVGRLGAMESASEGDEFSVSDAQVALTVNALTIGGGLAIAGGGGLLLSGLLSDGGGGMGLGVRWAF